MRKRVGESETGHWRSFLILEFIEPTAWRPEVVPARESCLSAVGKRDSPAELNGLFALVSKSPGAKDFHDR